MSDRKVLRVSEETEASVRAYAEAKGIPVGEAADKLIGTAVARLDALKRYASNKQPLPPGKPRKKAEAKPAKAKAKKAKAKKAKKAPVEESVVYSGGHDEVAAELQN